MSRSCIRRFLAPGEAPRTGGTCARVFVAIDLECRISLVQGAATCSTGLPRTSHPRSAYSALLSMRTSTPIFGMPPPSLTTAGDTSGTQAGRRDVVVRVSVDGGLGGLLDYAGDL